ncbi:MAG: hypothetical protein M0001_06875 [Treponema sp.]|nr:hypothetical protein [Treponema sp.]
MKRWIPVAVFSLLAVLALVRQPANILAGRPAPPKDLPGAKEGRSYVFNLPSAPFPHEAREDGYSLDDAVFNRDDHYDDSSVSVFVPPGWSPRGRVNLVFFFHGWMSSREEAISGFDLFDQFSQSGVKALLVVPETAVHAPDSFGGKFEDQGGFARFVADLLHALDQDGIVPQARAGSIALAGHSGAYRVIASILRRGGLSANIREVWLFDALYAREAAFADWIASGKGRFICVSSKDSDTSDNAASLATLLHERGIDFTEAVDDPEDGDAIDARTVFLASESDHYGVVRDHSEFRTFLETSSFARTGATAGGMSKTAVSAGLRHGRR